MAKIHTTIQHLDMTRRRLTVGPTLHRTSKPMAAAAAAVGDTGEPRTALLQSALEISSEFIVVGTLKLDISPI